MYRVSFQLKGQQKQWGADEHHDGERNRAKPVPAPFAAGAHPVRDRDVPDRHALRSPTGWAPTARSAGTVGGEAGVAGQQARFVLFRDACGVVLAEGAEQACLRARRARVVLGP